MQHSITFKRVILVVISLLALALIAFVIVGWLASSKIMTVNPQKIEYDQTVIAVNNDQYTMQGSAYNITGIVGGIRSDGSMIGIFSAPINSNPAEKTSTRTLIQASDIRVGDKISLQGNIWTTDPQKAVGIPYQDITYTTELGKNNAWLVPGTNTNKWVIGVHGIGADKTEMLRFIKPVHDAGNTMMVINYRNDTNNPAAPDNRNHLGDTEWRDVEAAVEYAKAQGATEIGLYGSSLGGSLVENYLRRSSSTQNVDKVILDSPALDWGEVLRKQAQKNGFPTAVYYPSAVMLKLRADISIDRISTHPDDIRHKTLIIHSADDATVPQAASKKLAAARPDLVTLVDFGKGGHLRSWNHDQTRYEQIVTKFLSE